MRLTRTDSVGFTREGVCRLFVIETDVAQNDPICPVVTRGRPLDIATFSIVKRERLKLNRVAINRRRIYQSASSDLDESVEVVIVGNLNVKVSSAAVICSAIVAVAESDPINGHTGA